MAGMHQWEVDLERQRDAVRDRQRIAELEAEVARLRDHAQDESNYEACSRCGGTGLVLGGAGEPTECSTCKGNTVVRTPAAVEPAQDPCKCDWATGECQGPLGCQAVTASLRTPAEGVWQPIETAPKNHSPVQVYGPYGQLTAFRDVTWAWWPCPAHEALDYVPTHWKPLGPSPEHSSTVGAANE